MAMVTVFPRQKAQIWVETIEVGKILIGYLQAMHHVKPGREFHHTKNHCKYCKKRHDDNPSHENRHPAQPLLQRKLLVQPLLSTIFARTGVGANGPPMWTDRSRPPRFSKSRSTRMAQLGIRELGKDSLT
jgi:hypothetical protein